jgi:hypothetical protein
MDYMGLAAAVVFATFWYKGAEMEKVNPLYWLGPSLIVSALAIFALQKGWLAVVLGQVALLVAITVYRTIKDKPRSES